MKRGIPVFLVACTAGLAQQYVAWTVAGGGPPFTPVAAVNASIAPGSLASDAAGNVYIRGFQCVLKVDPHGILTLVAVRRVSTSGIVTTFAGGGTGQHSGQFPEVAIRLTQVLAIGSTWWGGRPHPRGGPCLRFRQRDEGVPRGPGGPPHQAAARAIT